MSNLDLNSQINSVFEKVKKELNGNAGKLIPDLLSGSKKSSSPLSKVMGGISALTGKGSGSNDLTSKLMDIGTKAVTDFKNNISNVPEPQRSKAVDELKGKITSEVKSIVQTQFLSKLKG